MEVLSDIRCFEGRQLQCKHESKTCNSDMVFSVFLPPKAEHERVPVLYWLSGLTCTDQNFVSKAGAQRKAAELGIAIVCADTSPRGEKVADDPEGAYDLGLGAGFYVNATEEPWREHYQMFDYLSQELPELVLNEFALDENRQSISGHSMGGHGALTIGLHFPDRYKSISAFSPIVSPINCPWGQKALNAYLGSDSEAWRAHDSCHLITQATQHQAILVDQGTADSFLEEQLKTELLVQAASTANYPVQIRYQQGYDHSYFFIASFIDDHIDFHAQHASV